eukprot:TRINITY_DN1860_c0_g1_i1.p1 TRINITY_DN1860_c0_g1~~TRINITY_DN1860_c0_g1_i1.p1  ORF type:complete len:1681 (-),score=261.51 TRINITY_DN1860_c0_g1_i1:48-4424(-)
MSVTSTEFRQRIFSLFIRICSGTRICMLCSAPHVQLNKEQSLKIFQKPLPVNRVATLYHNNILYSSVFLRESQRGKKSFFDEISAFLLRYKLKSEKTYSDGDDEIEVVFEKDSNKAKQRLMNSRETYLHIQRLWKNESEVTNELFTSTFLRSSTRQEYVSPDIFFLHRILVPPSRFRIPAVTKKLISEHASCTHLKKVLEQTKLLTELRQKASSDPKVEISVDYSNILVNIQTAVNNFMDSKDGGKGIRQLLEKKEGLFRKNMMGKRVNYTARSVISPDVSLDTNEIGVPKLFATTLTFPEPVNDINVKFLRRLIINGPDNWPGANKIEDEDGKLTVLPQAKEERIAIAKMLQKPSYTREGIANKGSKKVHRHCLNGDYLLVNRQPTLHKPSMMAHRAYVLGKENTIHMHYANCNSYNADFDGDEMNLHLPQNQIARAEAANIVLNDYQYLVPKDGTPLRGLIQDHIVSGVLLTRMDNFFTQHEFQQLVYYCCSKLNTSHRLETPPPTILKPQVLWTGKQVITALLNHLLKGKKPLNLTSKAQIPGDLWGKNSMEGMITIRNNELLTGAIGKKQFGAKEHGLVHAVYELYGARAAGQLLSCLGRVFTFYLQMRGFTCGLDDMVLLSSSENARREILNKSDEVGYQKAGIFSGLFTEAEVPSESARQKLKPSRFAKTEIMNSLSELLKSPDEAANWDSFMIGHNSKVTSQVIDVCLESFKKFPKNNFTLMTTSGAKGSKVNYSQIVCLLGQQELEGRRVPMTINGKTLPCFTPYDPSPSAGGFIGSRFFSGLQPQEFYFHCMAGREGLVDTAVKTSRSGYLQRCIIKHLESLCVRYDNTVRDSDGSIIQFFYGEDGLDVTKTSFLNQFDFLADNMEPMKDLFKYEQNRPRLEVLDKKVCTSKMPSTEDPLLSTYSPGTYLGSISEKYSAALETYISKNLHRFSGKKNSKAANEFRELIYMKYMFSLAQPGENVGVLAGQSIGEPSTQMTLNTFHLAGKGEVNVTLGIPRLRELFMAAAGDNKTPSMTIPLKKTFGEDVANKLSAKLQRIPFSDIVKEIIVKESLEMSAIPEKVYDVTIHIDELANKLDLNWSLLETKLTRAFLPKVIRSLNRHVKSSTVPAAGLIQQYEYIDSVAASITSGITEDADTDQQKDTSDSQKSKKQDNGTYDEPDEDDVKSKKKKNAKEKTTKDQDSVESDDDKASENQKEATETDDAMEVTKDKEIADSCPFIKDYIFDEKQRTFRIIINLPAITPKILMLSFLEQQCETFMIQEVKGISRCTVIKPTDKEPRYVLQTEGIDVAQIWRLFSLVDVDDIGINQLKSIYESYGIEAVRAAIIKESSAVFNAYGIGVSFRHLSLIADYMTFQGKLRSMTRSGISASPSPFLKMSYETTIQFLKKAVILGEYESMQTPSSSIVIGNPPDIGTGIFDIHVGLKQFLQKKPQVKVANAKAGILPSHE